MQERPPGGLDATMAAATGPIDQTAPVVDPARDRTFLADASGSTLLASDRPPRGSDDPEARPERLGRYLVTGRLGAGGMGVVYAAYDPELERKVAIKLIRGHADDAAQKRLQREAQAMAKLSHPNVVAVHDVGAFEGQIFIAMEFVRGQTLGAWIRQSPRTWREVLAVFLAAGRGLAAAHEAGLVHRDFKPDNVLLDESGRPRVTDFGLARAAGGLDPSLDVPSAVRRAVPDIALTGALSVPLTMHGAVMGTPAYMAAEQHEGRVADARTDQYAFCASLYEALYGELPYGGSSLVELAANVTAGRLREPPRGRRVPAFVHRAVIRGLSPEPARRWPDMPALLRALARDPARVRRRVLAGALLLALGAGGAAAALAAPDPCGGAEERLRGVWDEARAGGVAAALRATGVAFAGETWSLVQGALDRYARTWSIMHAQACMSHQRGETSGELLDLQMACLDDRRDTLAAFVDVLAAADAGVAERAVQASAGLPRLEPCADGRALRTGIPAATAGQETAVAATRATLARARAEAAAGRYAAALALTAEAEAEARALAYRPLLAEALLRRGAVLRLAGEAQAADTALTEAWTAALATRHDEVAAEAAVEEVGVVGRDLARKEAGLRWAGDAGAMLDRRDRADDLPARYQLGLGGMYVRTGQFDRAVEALQRAVAMREADLGAAHPDVAAARTALGEALRRQGKFAEAAAAHELALRDTIAAFGPGHPQVAIARNNLGVAYGWLGRQDDAIAEFEAAVALRERALGPAHPLVASARSNLATALIEQGRLDAAEAELRRAIAGFERGDKIHPDLSDAQNNLGNLHFAAGRLEEALFAYSAALANDAALLGEESVQASLSRSNVGTALWQLGRLDEAERELRRALASLERDLGPEHPHVAFPLLGLGAALADRGAAGEGAPFLARAAALAAAQDDPGLRATVRSELARARFAIARDRTKGHAVKHMSRDPAWAEARREVEAALADLRRAGPLYAHARRRAEAFLAAGAP